MIKIVSLIIILFFSFSINVHISGHLRDDRIVYPSQFGYRKLVLMTGNKIIASTKTDSSGYYELYFLDTLPRNTVFDFYLAAHSDKDTFLLKSVSRFESDTPIIDLIIFRKMKMKMKRNR